MALTTDLSSHLALVTGATGGIGKATCLALAHLNCSIAVHYHSASDTAESLVAQLTSMNVRASAFRADLSSYDETRALHANVVRELGHPTILFNNAGLTMGVSRVKDVSEVRTALCIVQIGPSRLVHWLAGAYAKTGVTINGVAPALIEETKMLPGGSAELSAKIPIGRLGKPEEIAETVLWIVKTGYVHNKIIAVDGGMFIQ
ncbi:hypothetical protein CLAIMM_08298 [Cladophialophora immunda]|nr:hypothetical protein CLAIMM_08298 [Cladophialophora immunda]